MDAFSRKKERLTLNTQELNLHGSKKKVPLGCQGQVDCLAGQVMSKAYLPNPGKSPGKSSSNKIINPSFKPQYPHTNPSNWSPYISFKK